MSVLCVWCAWVPRAAKMLVCSKQDCSRTPQAWVLRLEASLHLGISDVELNAPGVAHL